MELNTFEVSVFGQNIRFKSDKDMPHIQALVDKFYKKLNEIQNTAPSVEPVKILTLLSLNLLEEYEDLQKKQEGERVDIEERIKKLSLKISHTLGDKNA